MKKEMPLVSIITPCFNGENFLGRFLNSLLTQDYQRIEFILINDGSTDATDMVVNEYRNRMENKLERFIYVQQENQGQAAALNQGLAVFQGDYLTWPDSDDFFPNKNVISTKVKWMMEHPTVDILCSRANIVNELNIKQITGCLKCKPAANSKKQFENFLLNKNVCFAPGCFFVKREIFLKAIPARQIPVYEKLGQNWQMLLPIVLNGKVGFTSQRLYTYVVRKTSHSHSIESYSQKMEISNLYKSALLDMLNGYGIDNEWHEQLNKKIIRKYTKEQVGYSLLSGVPYTISNSEMFSFLDHFRFIYSAVLYVIKEKIKTINIIKRMYTTIRKIIYK